MIDDMSRQMTEEEIFEKLDEYVKLYKDTHNVEDIEDVRDTIDFWRHISGHKLDIDFIRYFQDELHWDMISSYASFVIDDIEEFEDKIVWNDIWMNSSLTTEIVNKYQDKINMKYVSVDLLGEDYLIKNQDIIDFDWCRISDICHDFSNNFFEKCSDKLYWWRISRWNKNINEEFIHLFHDKLDWCDLLEYNDFEVSDNLLNKYKDLIELE